VCAVCHHPTLKMPNAQVNRQKCGAFLSALNRQLELWR